MNLYLVTCKGMTYTSAGVCATHGRVYVIANNPTEAYEKVKAVNIDNKVGSSRERALDSVQLIAESSFYPNCGTPLYLPDQDYGNYTSVSSMTQ